MSLRRAPISVFIAITPTSFLWPCREGGQLGLQGDEMEGVAQAGDELRVLAEAAGDQHHVDRPCSIAYSRHSASRLPARNAAKADLALRFGALGERPPFLVLQAREVVHGVIEVDVQVVGLQAAQMPSSAVIMSA